MNPDFPAALNNLAWVRATHPDEALRDGARAVELAERYCQLTGHQPAGVLGTLAAACAEAGRFDDAIRWQTKAVELAPEAGEAQLRGRLELYKAGKPYREKPWGEKGVRTLLPGRPAGCFAQKSPDPFFFFRRVLRTKES